MNAQTRRLLITMTKVLLIVLLVLPTAVCASISSPDSHITLSEDGTRLLVMLSWDVKYDQTPTATLPDGRTVTLRSTFAKSGAYDAASLAPIWQVDWFAFKRDLRWSADFRHVVRRNRKGFRSDWALAFYDDGKVIKDYDCAHLLTIPRGDWCLPYETSDWHRRWYEDFELSADRSQVLLSLARRRVQLGSKAIDLGLQELYIFDLATGVVVTRRSVGGWRIWAYGVATVGIGLVALAAVFALWLLWRKRRAYVRRRGFPVITAPPRP
jgi:hypothetical protein